MTSISKFFNKQLKGSLSGLGFLFVLVFNVQAQLPQDHTYQVTLRDYIGTLQESDFEVALSELTVDESYFSTEDDIFKTWLAFGSELYWTSDITRGIRVNPSHFTLSAIEAGGSVNMSVGKGQWISPVATAFWADWDYSGNPHRGKQAVKLRTFVAAAVDMMMQDREHEDGENDRSDFLGTQLARWGYVYSVVKSELPQQVREAYEAGLVKMFERLEQWGPTGTHADMDMGALVGMWYAANHVDSQDLIQRAKDHTDLILGKHLFDAGYIDHGGGYDAGYNGISQYFLLWAAQISNYAPIEEAVKKIAKFKAYQILPDPDGKWFSPYHTNPSSGSDAANDLWGPYYRDVGIADYSDDLAFLILGGEDKTEKIHDEQTMISHMENTLQYVHDPDRSALTTSSSSTPSVWQHSHWIPTESMNGTSLYYEEGLYDKLRTLQNMNSSFTKPAFSRNTDFIESFSDKFLSVKKGGYGVLIFNDRLSWWTSEGQTQKLNGFGGGNLSAFWTPETGTVLLGASRGTHNGGHNLDEWRTWPVHALSGETAGGQAFSSGLQRHPIASYELSQEMPTVTVSGDLSNIHSDPTDGLGGQADYERVFKVEENGIRVTTTVAADGSNTVDELYEILPVFRRDAYRQSSATPTTIEFEVNGSWQQAGTTLQEVTRIRLQRFGGQVLIEFAEPAHVKLSSQEFYLNPDTQNGTQVRNIMIDLLDSGGQSTSLGNHTVEYTIYNPNASSGGSDNTVPDVEISHTPSNPDDTEEVTFSASATDASGIKELKIYVNDNLAKTCASESCEYSGGPYSIGDHNYYAVAVDDSENQNSSSTEKQGFFVEDASGDSDNDDSTNNSPTHDEPELVSSGNSFIDTADLEAVAKNVSDADGDPATLNYDWREDNISVAVLNLSFDTELTDASSGIIKDYSTYQNNATFDIENQIPAWTSNGSVGGAYHFDGTDDYIRIPSDTSFDELENITLEAWIKHDDWGQGYAEIISKPYFTDNWENPWVTFKLGRSGSTDNIDFQLTVSNEEPVILTSKSAIKSNEWTHLAATYDGSEMRIYVNGEIDVSRSETRELVSRPGTDIFIGKNWNNDSPNNAYSGIIDELRIYKRALSPIQIQSHFKKNYHILASTETKAGESYSAMLTPNDGKERGESKVTQTETIIQQVDDQDDAEKISLSQNFPNPFNPSTNISYTVNSQAEVSLEVYNLLGQKVATLVEDEQMSQGTYVVQFNASDLTSGVYFYKLNVADIVLTKKMTLIK